MKKGLKILLVNAVTSIRVLGIALLVPMYTMYGGLALALTNIACFLTDLVDGKLARGMNASTFFGSLYDGLADKAFLIVNIAILCSVTPWAIIPIVLELGIMGTQLNKFNSNVNVQSNIFGKLKMWVAGLSVVISNLLIDVEKLNFLGTEIIAKLSNVSAASLVEKSLMPLIVAEIITLVSYILEKVRDNKDIKVEEIKEEISMVEEEIKTEGEREELSKVDEKIDKIQELEKSDDEVTEEKEEQISLKDMLFDTEFYQEHKDEDGLKLLLKRRKR